MILAKPKQPSAKTGSTRHLVLTKQSFPNQWVGRVLRHRCLPSSNRQVSKDRSKAPRPLRTCAVSFNEIRKRPRNLIRQSKSEQEGAVSNPSHFFSCGGLET